MRIDRWTLEILVNERPLQEYVVPDSVLGASASNALKSYVLEGTRKKFCDSATFVAVPTAGTYYTIKVSPSTKEIAAKVFVDGVSDGSNAKRSDSYSIIRGFRNKNRTMIYNFIFDKTEWIETNITQNTKFGGLGAISVYFYKIKKRYKSCKSNYDSNKAFEEVKIPETKKCFDVALTTKFSEGVKYRRSSLLNKIKRDKKPLAVLHINYRLADWLAMKGVSIQENQMAVNTFISSVYQTNTHTQNTCASTSAATYIKSEVKIENDIEDKTSINQVIGKRNRGHQEIIVISDSDEERADEVIELD